MTLDEAKFLLMKELNNDDGDFLSMTADKFKAEKEQFVLNIYEYWKAKRIKLVIFTMTKQSHLRLIVHFICVFPLE